MSNQSISFESLCIESEPQTRAKSQQILHKPQAKIQIESL